MDPDWPGRTAIPATGRGPLQGLLIVSALCMHRMMELDREVPISSMGGVVNSRKQISAVITVAITEEFYDERVHIVRKGRIRFLGPVRFLWASCTKRRAQDDWLSVSFLPQLDSGRR